MKTNSTSKNKMRIITVVAVLLLCCAVFVIYTLYKPERPGSTKYDDSTINYKPATKEEIAEGNTAKEETIQENSSENATDAPAKSISQQITSSSISDGVLYVRNEIVGVYTSGSCTLTMSKDSQSIVKKSGVQALAKTSTCKGFNIPVSELSKGIWSIILTVVVSDKTADDLVEVEI